MTSSAVNFLAKRHIKQLKMNLSHLQILSCPLCKGDLQVKTERLVRGDVIEGHLLCHSCDAIYSISDGIPNLYISDEQVIENSPERRFPQFIVTQKKLNAYDHPQKSKGELHYQGAKRVLPAFFIGFGWILFFLGIFQVLLKVSFPDSNLPFPSSLLLIAALFVFAVDYGAYRSSSKSEYLFSMDRLRELSGKQKLSEYDIRAVVKDNEENCSFNDQRSLVEYKGAWVQSLLDREGFDVDKALNVGCGGWLHRSVSKPYFDRGYVMIGLDISREYLEQFAQEFDADAVLANSLALPFKPNTFNLVGFTDVLEHVHHPLLGLLEVHSVLNAGGAILLSTNNRCAIKRLRHLNPIILVERVLSLRYDEILPPRNVLESWMDSHFYHTEFSKNEITRLLETSGFCITSIETRFPSTNRVNIVNSAFGKMPLLKYLCSEFFIVARKDQ